MILILYDKISDTGTIARYDRLTFQINRKNFWQIKNLQARTIAIVSFQSTSRGDGFSYGINCWISIFKKVIKLMIVISLMILSIYSHEFVFETHAKLMLVYS